MSRLKPRPIRGMRLTRKQKQIPRRWARFGHEPLFGITAVA